MKGKLARVRYDISLYKYQIVRSIIQERALACTDDLVIIITIDCYGGADEYLVHHQRLGKQYYISKLALELVE